MPQVYIREGTYQKIIDSGVMKREDIRDFVNDAIDAVIKSKEQGDSQQASQ